MPVPDSVELRLLDQRQQVVVLDHQQPLRRQRAGSHRELPGQVLFVSQAVNIYHQVRRLAVRYRLAAVPRQRVEPGAAMVAGEFADRATHEERVVGQHRSNRPRRVPSAGLALHRTYGLLSERLHGA